MNNLSTNLTEGCERNVTFKVEGNEDCHGYLTGSSEWGLVLIQEWWGLNKSIALTCDKFASKGFRVLCPDLYRGKVSKDVDEASHNFKNLDWKNAVKDIEAAGLYLKSLGCTKVAITGFCLGGALTIATLTLYPDLFTAGVPFYGVPDLSNYNLGNIKCPILAHFGEKDCAAGFSDPEAARKLESASKEAGVNFTLHMWENADHAFMNQDRDTYNPDLANRAMDETVEFIKKANQ
jgi:carboxymethylenebutenolidase